LYISYCTSLKIRCQPGKYLKKPVDIAKRGAYNECIGKHFCRKSKTLAKIVHKVHNSEQKKSRVHVAKASSAAILPQEQTEPITETDR
jgi:hypothetical protein